MNARSQADPVSDPASSASLGEVETQAFAPAPLSSGAAAETPATQPRDTTAPPEADGRGQSQAEAELPERVGRYRVERLLGRGGFGLVLLARDEQLERPVAIKLPHPHLLERPEDTQLYLAEARTVAQLDHRWIVPVYDVGSTAEHPCFVVSKYIEGESLAARLRRGRLPLRKAVELTAALAEALQYAHARDVVHRDVKPGNVLLDASGRAFLVDFGLALGPDSFGQGSRLCGTVNYMSPEQAGGRAQHVDGRSDIYSLGVLLYELLTGALPYRGRERDSVLAEVADVSIPVRPLRQVDATLPAELERVCQRALAKRPDDRYTTAADMAADLRAYLAAEDDGQKPAAVAPAAPPRRRAAVLGGLVAAAALVIVFARFVVVPYWAERPTPASSNAAAAGASQSSPAAAGGAAAAAGAATTLAPIKVQAVEFQQLVLDAQGNHERSGAVFDDPYQLREGDGLQFRAELSRPAYCFWLGFQPDGGIDVCFPEDEDQPPPLTDAPTYPVDDPQGEVYGLTDGVGVQAFALVVSDTPLPSFYAWRASLGDSPWRPTHDVVADKIFSHRDGWEEVFELHRRYRNDTRGAGVPLQGRPSVLADLVGWLRSDEQVVAVQAWALPVRPRSGGGAP